MLKEILTHEVFPALGCTEPIAVAYAAGIAGREATGDIENLHITVDPGIFKNGFAVTVPNTGGEKGNLIAGVLGALIRKPELKMEILQGATEEMIAEARELIAAKKAIIDLDKSKADLSIDVRLKTENDSVRAIIEKSHTNLVFLEKNSKTLYSEEQDGPQDLRREYKPVLKRMKISDFVDLAVSMSDEEYVYIKEGIDMNLRMSGEGQTLRKVGYYVSELIKKGYLVEDVFSSSKVLTASAVDARMAGLNFPVMSSGGSGNQGIVAILVPYNVGHHFGIEESIVLQSIGLSHMVNGYIKCFTGDLSPLCGCSIAAGVGASVAIVFQQYGGDMDKITLAVNTVISDLGGMLCDGAKGGCALKVASSTDSAIRAAYMAMNNHGITHSEGFVGKTAEETIRHLSEISKLGMAGVDDTILDIMIEKGL